MSESNWNFHCVRMYQLSAEVAIFHILLIKGIVGLLVNLWLFGDRLLEY